MYGDNTKEKGRNVVILEKSFYIIPKLIQFQSEVNRKKLYILRSRATTKKITQKNTKNQVEGLNILEPDKSCSAIKLHYHAKGDSIHALNFFFKIS